MLECLIIAGSIFLTDGHHHVRHDNVFDYRLSGRGGVLYALTGTSSGGESFRVPDSMQGDTAAEVLATCVANARYVPGATN